MNSPDLNERRVSSDAGDACGCCANVTERDERSRYMSGAHKAA